MTYTVNGTIFNRKERLPEYGTYVVCRYTGRNWLDSEDQEGCVWLVCKFDRADCYDPNNTLEYCWRTFGPAKLLGHEVDLWFELPRNVGVL